MQEVVYHTNYKVENEYFWFLARNEIFSKVIKNVTDLKDGDNVVDIGCGTGGFASVLNKRFNVACLDMEQLALDYCKKRGLEDLTLGTTKDLINSGRKFKAAFMMDVIEHIEDDQDVVNDVYEIIEPGGWFIAAVPAYQWLWSEHDEVHMHYRRYKKSNFKKLFKNAGFEIRFDSYINSFLFPPVVLKRFLDKIMGVKKKKDEPVDEVPEFLNKIFLKIFSSESTLLPAFKFPFGLSILLVAQKAKSHE